MISGLTAHVWVADATSTYHTASDLRTEWHNDYAAMLAGHGDTLTAMQRMEGNAEAVIENTGAAHLSTGKQAQLREDLQREYDAIGAAMQIDSHQYGIDPGREFNSYTYLKMEQTLQGNEELLELGYQGHGVNDPAAAKYDGFTTDFQHKVDGKTFYVGGGVGNGEKAIAGFLDDDVLTHAPFPQRHAGRRREATRSERRSRRHGSPTPSPPSTRPPMPASSSPATSAPTRPRSAPSSRFPTSWPPRRSRSRPPARSPRSTAASSPAPSPARPHSWVADGTGLFHTGNLASEWKADLALLKSGATLTSVQRWEANAELVIENTNAAKLSANGAAGPARRRPARDRRGLDRDGDQPDQSGHRRHRPLHHRDLSGHGAHPPRR